MDPPPSCKGTISSQIVDTTALCRNLNRVAKELPLHRKSTIADAKLEHILGKLGNLFLKKTFFILLPLRA